MQDRHSSLRYTRDSVAARVPIVSIDRASHDPGFRILKAAAPPLRGFAGARYNRLRGTLNIKCWSTTGRLFIFDQRSAQPPSYASPSSSSSSLHVEKAYASDSRHNDRYSHHDITRSTHVSVATRVSTGERGPQQP